MKRIKEFLKTGCRHSRTGGVARVAALLTGVTAVCFSMPGAEPASGGAAVSTPSKPGAGTSIVLKSSNSDGKHSAADLDSLRGQSAVEVEAALGKSSGKLQTTQGATWLYPDWRVQFDQAGKVIRVEKDQPVRLARVDPRFLAAADAVAKAQAERAAADDAARIKAALSSVEDVRVVSNGGAEVDLASLLAADKVTIVDFYADWCGPCQKLSPELEKLAKDDPDVVLLKVDIVNWNTPVTAQFGINSIPNVRVFNRGKAQVGSPTHSINSVTDLVRRAKGA